MKAYEHLRFRQIHLDFHTSPDIENVAVNFNPEEFALTLKSAKVNSITCFARCHHGMLYYDSRKYPERIHPNLKNRNLLKEQIEACHKHDIRVPVYITVQWDQFTAEEHPEWLAIDANGGYIGTPVYEAGFYRTLCLNTPYRDFLKTQVKEVLETFDPVDGLFFDILFVSECSCKNCRTAMEVRGYNPRNREDRLKYAAEMLDDFARDMTSFIRQYNKECSIFYNKSHIGPAHKPVADAYTHFEMESLPSGSWGYMHFPTTARYARHLGKDCLGMTGKFHTEWGDFHSLKNKEALEYECFRMLALNTKCMIGDQMEPGGRLSDSVYKLIGPVYSEIEKKEPWCSDAKPVVDIGVFTPEEFMGSRQNSAITGITRMLEESGHQFDIIDSKDEFTFYKLLVLPDNIQVSEEFAGRLHEYVDKGGSIIGSFESGLNEDKTKFNFTKFNIKMKKDITCDYDGQPVRGKLYHRAAYADYILPKGEIAKGLYQTEYVMYMKGLEVIADEESEVLAEAILPYFNRTYKHYCSHRQAPSSGKVGYAGIVRSGNVIYFAHPIFTQYHINAPRWCKILFLNAVDLLLSDPILRHTGPSTLLATVNEQAMDNRWIVHLLHYIPQRKCIDMDIIEDIIPLYNINISLKMPDKVTGVTLVPEKKALEFRMKNERLEVTVPKVEGHRMIEIKFN